MRILLVKQNDNDALFIMRADDDRLGQDNFKFVSCGRRQGNEYHAANGRVYRINSHGAVSWEER